MNKIRYINLASNFFVGNTPEVTVDTTSADFRFNYFSDCGNELCCLIHTDCASQCTADTSGPAEDYLPPLGIEASLWTELNVELLGEKKRIIQIQTHFASSPHILSSHACPNTTDFGPCDPLNSTVNVTFGSIPLEKNIPYSNSQNPNTYEKFLYAIQGDPCSTTVKVSMDDLHMLRN
jgi:hypothetical protein